MFESGNSGNKRGRPKGSTNIATKEVRNGIRLLFENNLKRMQKDLDALEPKDRIKFMLDMASFIIPKLKAVEVTNDEVTRSIHSIEFESQGLQALEKYFETKN